MEIYAYAKRFMRENGNPSQWGNSRPSALTVASDIDDYNCFVIAQGVEIYGVFAFIIGNDPTYDVIENGSWLNDEPYGVIHRIASAGICHGIMDLALDYCESQIGNIRIDTHRDNKIMQHILDRHNYIKCGTIYADDATPRIAYQKQISNE
jgi:hypothetical protein